MYVVRVRDTADPKGSFNGVSPSWENAERADMKMKWQVPTLLC